MSLSRRRYPVSRRLGLLGVLFSALFALTLFPSSVATAQEVKQIKLNEKHMQGFIAVSADMAKRSPMEPIRTNWTRSWKLRPRLLSRKTVLQISPSSTTCQLIFR
jgi:hypothetical protein